MPATQPPDTALFLPGAIIAERYEVIKTLGSGGMGVVLSVLDHALDNEPTAIKLLYPHHVQDPIIFARFRNEVLVARQLAHPNIVRIYDFGSAGQGYYFITMEYVRGANLKNRMYNRHLERLTFPEIVRILYEIGQGVGYAHRKGVVHRDLKPDNILMTESGEVRVTDFGLARLMDIDKGFTRTGETVGTPYYMAPEQIRGNHVDGRADIYSLGIMAYEMVTNTRPFEDECWFTLAGMHMRNPIPEFAKEYDVPRWFETFVFQSAAKRAEDRFANAEEWCEELLSHVDGGNRKRFSPAVFSKVFGDALRRKRSQRIRKVKLVRLAVTVGLLLCLTVLPIGFVRMSTGAQSALLGFLTGVEKNLGIGMGSAKRAFGVDVNATPESIFEAVNKGDLNQIALLIAAGVSPNSTNADGNSLIAIAAAQKRAEVVQLLLEHGGDPNAPGAGGETALMISAALDEVPLIVPLLEAGANVNARDLSGRSPLFHAVLKGKLGAAQELVRRGAFVNGRDNDGTPVIIAAVHGESSPVAQFILDSGAKVDDKDKAGWTALMHAVRAGNIPMTQLLLQHGADKQAKNLDGKDARDLASGQVRSLLSSQSSSASRDDARDVAKSNPSTTIQYSEAGLTRLRVIGDAQGVWRVGVITKLEKVSTSIRNVGEERAEAVQVRALIPGGREFVLTGPSDLAPNSVAVYQGEIEPGKQVVPSQGEIKITASCKNCRK